MSGGTFEVDAERWCELNDELDRLTVEKAANAQTMAALRAENERLRDLVLTIRDTLPIAYRNGQGQLSQAEYECILANIDAVMCQEGTK